MHVIGVRIGISDAFHRL